MENFKFKIPITFYVEVEVEAKDKDHAKQQLNSLTLFSEIDGFDCIYITKGKISHLVIPNLDNC